MSRAGQLHSLSAQLFFRVLLSLLAGAAVFFALFSAGNLLVDRSVYGRPFAKQMADHEFARLQAYVEQEQITTADLDRLDTWCSRADKLYLTIYRDGVLLYVSPQPWLVSTDPADFDPDSENPECAHLLTLSDGTVTRVFLYCAVGNMFYFWVAAAAGALAFLTFSLCFITFVRRKLRYVKQLKAELDILASGQLDYPVTVHGTDELGELAAGIDQMRQSILHHRDTEDQIRTANSRLVTAMSHDLRTPLTSLLGYLELLDQGRYADETQLRRFTRQSLEQALRIKTMADQLFEYFLVYASEEERPDMTLEDADTIFLQFWQEYTFALESQGFIVNLAFSPLRGRVEINLELLRRAFDNLYANLLKYAAPSHPIEIICRREGDALRLCLVNGVSPRQDRRESTNIGLNTCRRILQLHGGSFDSAENDGTFCVELTIPLLAYPAEEQAEAVPLPF
ncbi:MAG: HAMP domain-containing histidine kinase [Oscillospiraceae bacterium]|nr:HAMP domain-containing histidine kinase [Oscillospiraceae bacterium]